MRDPEIGIGIVAHVLLDYRARTRAADRTRLFPVSLFRLQMTNHCRQTHEGRSFCAIVRECTRVDRTVAGAFVAHVRARREFLFCSKARRLDAS